MPLHDLFNALGIRVKGVTIGGRMTKYISDDEIVDRTKHHPPTSQEVIDAHETVRDGFGRLGLRLNNLLPEGPAKTRAINNLMDVMSQCNAVVAIAQDVFRAEPEHSTCVDCNRNVMRLAPPGSKWQHVPYDSEPKHPAIPRPLS